ncbi:DNA polymerase III subunit epsilon [Salipaludibacillus keqinensis]|jgi:DNA polymerase III subunit epsilon|uniref:DNA polymerase III subunit epsilon n=1 Tax=Salipaludibacillus keqinensis TaxID=2045207 RepID=A0A323TJD7_9BACI|nr:exonuclease domain-containing protein [Salipaludibacillus keqinensis]PYZ95222.1 DNA polymerase III subunit epsilon [Salipaludibacillus keqinensis]
MEASVIQIFKYLLYDWHQFNYSQKQWVKQNHDKFHDIHDQMEQGLLNSDLIKKPIRDIPFTVFDLETTGFFPKIGDEVISIGALKMNMNQMEFPESFYEVISPIKMASLNIRTLTGLSMSEIRSGKPFPVGFLNFWEFSRSSVVVAHPASFDVNFLKEMAHRWKLPPYNPVSIDSYEMANFLYPNNRNSLDELVHHFGVEEKLRHHALNDAHMTAEVFQYLVNELEKKGIYTIDDYWQACKKPRS